MRFDLEVSDKQALARFDDLEKRAGDIKPVFDQVGRIFTAGLKRTWHTQGSYIDKPWPALAAATIERKAREGKSPQMLKATGQLEAAVTGKSFMRIAKTQVRVGVKDFRGRFHQGGTSQGMPARPLVGIAKQDRKDIFRIVLNHFQDDK